jgi:hypothetical protein
MMKNHFEDELDAIRIRLYEQTKDMTREERVAYENNRVEQIFNAHGIRPVYRDTVMK